MKIEVKLYSYHDMDLVGLYKTGKISFPETTRQILNSYANKDVYKVKVLKTNEDRLAKYPKDSFRKYYHYHVLLDKKTDADAIALLKRITPGYRNNFIKVVLRQYLCGVFLPEYFVEGDNRFFNEMSRRFQGDRDEREIRQTKRKSEKPRDFAQPESEKEMAAHKKNPVENTIQGDLKDVKRDISIYEQNNTHTPVEDSAAASDIINYRNNNKKKRNFSNEEILSVSDNKERPIISDVDNQADKGARRIEEAKFDDSLSSLSDSASKYKAYEDEQQPIESKGKPIIEDSVIQEDSFDDFDDFLDGTTEQY